mgnify:FL=1
MTERMISTWTYDGKEYYSDYAVRQAIFDKERKAFGPAPNDEDAVAQFWSTHGVTFTQTEYVPSLDELRARAVAKRDRLLVECDYYVLSDYPSTEAGMVAVKAYRQALRDVSQQATFPTSIVWPDKPAVLGG